MKMQFNIEKMKNKFEYFEGNSLVSLNGYAFIDDTGKCIIIVYGESRRDQISKYLNDESDIKVNIKYQNIEL